MKRRGVKLAARFLMMLLKDRGQAIPTGASRLTAKPEAISITNDLDSVETKLDLAQQRQQESPRDNGGYIYLKGAKLPLAVCEYGRPRREPKSYRRTLLRIARSVGSVRLGRRLTAILGH